MEKEYTYSAFISYSSKDEKVAKSLWKKLERYRLPAVLQKQHTDVPERMHIFLDQGDIVPGDTVENALSRELADSKKLIVVCSPNSARSKYVELEVKNFLSLGHSTNDIIPYIIGGEVNRESPFNCYVPSLFGDKEQDTLNGVSVLRDGKWKAFVGVLANLLDVKFDEIYKREKVRKNRITAVWSGLGFLIACFIGLIIWYVTPHTKYYADYVTRWGIPEGIRELNKEERKKYPLHYEIIFRAFKPIRLTHVNVFGTCVAESSLEEHQNRPRMANYLYKHPFLFSKDKRKWELEKAVYEIEPNLKDIYCPIYKMQLIYTRISPTESYVDFYYDSEDKLPKSILNDIFSSQNIFFSDIPFLSLNGYSENQSPEYIFFRQTSSIFRFKIDYDELNGWENKITFYNKNSHPVHDSNGINGYLQLHDEKGRIIEERYLYDSNNFYGFNNINTKKIEYDENDRLITIGFYYINKNQEKKNENNESVLYNENNIKNQISSDSENYNSNTGLLNSLIESLKKDNIQQIDLSFDSSTINDSVMTKKLVTNKSRNYAEKKIEWSESGNEYIQSISFYGDNGQKTIDKQFECERIENFYDVNGINLKQVSVSDDKCLVQEIITITEKGLPEKVKIMGDNYVYYKQNTYIDNLTLPSYRICDENGIVINELNLNVDKKDKQVILNKSFVTNSEMFNNKQIYDEYGRYIENISYIDDDSYSVKILYHGLNRSICYFKNNNYCPPDIAEYVRADFVYTNDGMIQLASFKDDKGIPIDSNDLGFSTYWAIYTPNSLLLMEQYLDSDDNYIIPKDLNYARFEAKNNLNDTILIEGKYLNEHGKLVDNGICSFNMEQLSDGTSVIKYCDINEFIIRKLYYLGDCIDKVTDCWLDDEDGYHEIVYSNEGIPLKAYESFDTGVAFIEYEYGKKIFSNFINNDGSREERFFNKDEECEKYIGYTASGEKNVEEIITYKNGVRAHGIDYFQNGDRTELICDEEGNPIQKIMYFFDTKQTINIFCEYENGLCMHTYGYSSDGNKYETFFDENGNKTYKMEYVSKYDEKKEWEFKDGILSLITVNSEGEERKYYCENGDVTYIVVSNLNGIQSELYRKNGEIVKRIDYYNGAESIEKKISIFENNKVVYNVDYYTDGTKEECFIDDDHKTMKIIKYKNETTKLSEIYREGNDISHIMKYNENGTKEDTFYDKNQYPIYIIYYSADDDIEKEVYMENQNGVMTYTKNVYSEGRIVESFFDNGHPVHFIEYDSNGIITYEECHNYENNILLYSVYYDIDRSKIEEFYENEKCVHQVCTSKDGVVEKEWFKKYEDGKVSYYLVYDIDRNKTEEFCENEKCVHQISTSKDGVIEKEWFKEYENGKLSYYLGYDIDRNKTEEFLENEKSVHQVCTSKDGVVEKEWFKKYENGNLIYVEYYGLDLKKREGYYKDNKTIRIVDYYFDGSKGEFFYDENEKCVHYLGTASDGSKIREEFGEYENDKLVHKTIYATDGSRIEEFYENEKIKHKIIYLPNGEKQEEIYE
ncbi:MAG: TIR domain-containing protein [Treponema sp.]|nr:TIR domain-containing protein [Treponema sp.]